MNQQILHDANEPCEEEDCQECCGEYVGHEFDTEEGGMCLNCGKNGYEG